MSLGLPCASVVLPTYNRYATLPFALRSVQQQSICDIEILLVLDGSPDSCRDIARSAAADDPRIRIFDREKAEGSGQRNIQEAVDAAVSEHVFYIDDDDLWLPEHLATLLPYLREFDVVDSRVASVGVVGGCLHLGSARPCAPHNRQQLASFMRKDLYDTHFAHTKTAFQRYSKWLPSDAELHRSVWQFMEGFARAASCRWTSCSVVTALSLHGAARKHMSPQERTDEIAALAADLADVATSAGFGNHIDRLYYVYSLVAKSAIAGHSWRSFCAMTNTYDDVCGDEECARLFALCQGQAIVPEQVIAMLPRITALVTGGYPGASIVHKLKAAYGAEMALEIVEKSLMQGNEKQTGLRYVAALLALNISRVRAQEHVITGLQWEGHISGSIRKLAEKHFPELLKSFSAG